MPNLADSLQCRSFVQKLEHCESKLHLMDNWEREFVEHMRELFDERETMLDMGRSPWNPTAGQANQLSSIAAQFR